MNQFVATGGNTLLQYGLETDPFPLVAGQQGTITIVVSNTGDQLVAVAQIKVAMTAGGDTVDLLASAPSTSDATIVRNDPPPASSGDKPTWQPTLAGDVFSFNPADGKPMTMRTQSLTITLSGLTIGTIPGTAPLTISEWAAVVPGTPPDPFASAPSGTLVQPLLKGPEGFCVGAFTAKPTTVNRGGSTTLAWSATGATQIIQYGNVVLGGPGAELHMSDSQTIDGLQDNPTIFTLTSTASDTSYYVQSQVSVTVIVPSPAIESFDAQITAYDLDRAQPQVTVQLSWTTSAVSQIEIDGVGVFRDQVALGGTRSVTVDAQPTLRFTMTATGLPDSPQGTVLAEAEVSVPSVTVNAYSVLSGTYDGSNFSIVAWDVDNTTQVSIDNMIDTPSRAAPGRSWGQIVKSGTAGALSARGYNPVSGRSAQASQYTGFGQPIVQEVRYRLGMRDGNRYNYAAWYIPPGPLDLGGWDFVFVLPIADANLAIATYNSWPLDWSAPNSLTGGITGTFGPWQITDNGADDWLYMSLPLTNCSIAAYSGGSAQVLLRLECLESGSITGTDLTINELLPAEGCSSNTIDDVALMASIRQWFESEVSTLVYVLKACDLAGSAGALGGGGMIKRTAFSFPWNSDKTQAALAVLTSTGTALRRGTPSLTTTVSPDLVSAACAMGHSCMFF